MTCSSILTRVIQTLILVYAFLLVIREYSAIFTTVGKTKLTTLNTQAGKRCMQVYRNQFMDNTVIKYKFVSGVDKSMLPVPKKMRAAEIEREHY